MAIYYAVLAGILTAAAVAVAVYLIITLAEVRRAVEEAQILIQKANGEVDKVGAVTSAVSGVAGAVGGSLGRTAVSVASVLFHIAKTFRNKKPREAEVVEEDR